MTFTIASNGMGALSPEERFFAVATKSASAAGDSSLLSAALLRRGRLAGDWTVASSSSSAISLRF